jgi:hypothetical protein
MNVSNVRLKPLVALLAGLLLIGTLITYSKLSISSQSEPVALALTQSLSVSIEPSSVQLNPNQIQVFTANVSTLEASLSYHWSIENSSTNNFVANGTHYLLLAQGNQAVFKFLEQPLDFCWLNVYVNSTSISGKATVAIQNLNLQPAKVTENQVSNVQPNQQTQTQSQNYYTNYYTTVNNLASTASYIVKTDGKDQYQVINGTDGNLITDYTSTSPDATLNNAIGLGGIVAIRAGNYSGTQLNVPANVSIVAEPGVTGIEYASIANGAKITEPTFNLAFGGYSSGSITVATNLTAAATSATWFLAFKPDNSIFYASTSSDTTLNCALETGGIIAIRAGNYSGAQLIVPSTASIIAEPNVTGIKYKSIAKSARIDEPSFNAAFGGYISGSYTVATNATASATLATFYVAFKPDNSIYFASTNAANVLNYAFAAAGNIMINNGTYSINTDLIINQSRLMVVGNGLVIIKALSGVRSMFQIYGVSAQNATAFSGIINLILDGNYNAINGIWLNNTWGARIEGIHAFNMCYCIWLDYFSQDTLVSNSNMGDSWVGIVINGTANQGFVSEDNWIGHNTLAGFKLTNNNENNKISLERTFFTNSNTYGIYCPSEDGHTLIGLTVKDCWVEDTFTSSYVGIDIYLKNAQTPIIQGNFLYRSQQKGDSHIILYNVVNGRISGNYICNSNSDRPLVTCAGVSQYNIFQDNVIIGSNIAYYLQDYAIKNVVYYSQTNCRTFIYAPVSQSSNTLIGAP